MAGSPLSAPLDIRARWYLQVEKYGKSVKEVCAIFGISRETYYKWFKRDHGLGSKRYRNRAIHPQAKLVGHIRVIVVNAKLQYNYGPKKMAAFLKEHHGTIVSPTAIYKFYKKKRLIKKPQKKQPWYTPMKRPFIAKKPGENVQLDVKYVPGPDRTWQYQYRFIDTVTNIQYAINTESRDSETTVYALHQAERSYPFRIQGIQTDNGGEFRGRFHEYLHEHKIIHRYIPKRSAPWNGKVERANRSVDDEFYLNPDRPWKTLSAYTHWYNHERPHLGKGMSGMTPYQKYLSLAKKKKCQA